MLPAKFCKENIVYPLRLREENGRKVLYVVLTDSFNLELLDQIKFRTDVNRVEPVISSQRAIETVIDRDYFKINLTVPALDYKKYNKNNISETEAEIDEDILVKEMDRIPSYSTPAPKSSKSQTETEIALVNLEAEVKVLKETIKDLNEDIKGLDRRNKALLKLLINKGFISREDYFQELKK